MFGKVGNLAIYLRPPIREDLKRALNGEKDLVGKFGS